MSRQSVRADDGTSLVIVLIIVTVISVVMGAVMSQVDTSVRTTVVLRDQASDVYAADAAGQALVTQIQNKKLACTSTSATSVDLGAGTSAPFYAPVATVDGSLNAHATCTPDTTDGVTTTTTTSGSGVGVGGSDNNLPAYALLAMEPKSLTEGITFPQSNKTICIENGKVASNSSINVNNNTLGVRLTGTGTASNCGTGSGTGLAVQAYGSNGSGGCRPSGGTYTPTPCTALPSLISPPTAPKPDTSAIGTVNPAPVCLTKSGKTYAAFVPGKYTSPTPLNTPCSGSAADFEWFSPGTYFFDYGPTVWSWPATLVGGTPTSGPTTSNANGSTSTPAITSVSPTTASTLSGLSGIAAWPTSSSQQPNACADPSAQQQYPGVEFVFGGTSTFTPNSGGNAEVCATYSPSAPPVAIYGTSSSSDVPGVSAETLCKSGSTAVTCSAATPSASGNTLMNTATNGQEQFYIKGFVYAPTAPVTLNVKNSNGQIFNWGVVVWNFSLNVNCSSPTVPFIKLPSPNQGFTQTTTTTYSIRYLSVWTCVAAATPCPATGAPDLRVKVQTQTDGSVKVLGWSERS